MLTEEQRNLICAALDGKQMQYLDPFTDQWRGTSMEAAINRVVSGRGVRIKPGPRVLHCVMLDSGSFIVFSGEETACEAGKYARIEIDEAGVITGKVEQ